MIVYLICCLASFLLARGEHFYLSGLCLMGAAVFLYVQDFRRTGKLTLLLFSFSQPAITNGPSVLIYPYIVQWLFRNHWTDAGINPAHSSSGF